MKIKNMEQITGVYTIAANNHYVIISGVGLIKANSYRHFSTPFFLCPDKPKNATIMIHKGKYGYVSFIFRMINQMSNIVSVPQKERIEENKTTLLDKYKRETTRTKQQINPNC